jgi:predicted double-glycine peptidase
VCGLSKDRSIWRKIQEAAYTIELEHDLSKRRILEIYLNTIYYGYGNHGITAAARYYYHETPDKLTLAQSAVLVGLVPSPPKIVASNDSGEPEYEDIQKLEDGESTAIGRIRFFFPETYSQPQADSALAIPLDRLLYPYKDAWDRGATDTIPGVWHNVGFYSYSDPDDPEDIPDVAPCLMPHLAAFIDEAHSRYELVGIDHLGVYNDRGMRQANAVLSAHAFGQAIDISGFRFADGSRLAVKDHADPNKRQKLLIMEALLKRHFDIVVDWNDDPLRHQTHFHCEVKGPRQAVPRDAAYQSPNIAKEYPVWSEGLEIHQTHPASCGPAALATVLNYYLGRPTTEADVMKEIGTDGNTGTGMDDLANGCAKMHISAQAEQISLSSLLDRLSTSRIPIPVVINVPDGHFVDVIGEDKGDLLISDPLTGNRLEPVSDFSREWHGDVLIVTGGDKKYMKTIS